MKTKYYRPRSFLYLGYFAQAQVKMKSATFVGQRTVFCYEITMLRTSLAYGMFIQIKRMYIVPTVEHLIHIKIYAFCAYRKKRMRILAAPTAAIQRYIRNAQ